MKAIDADKRVLQDHSVAVGLATAPIAAQSTESGLNTSEKNLLLELDGIYMTSADAELNSDNIKRLEQRLLNAQEYVYFRKDNKELNIDNKLFDPKLIRRTDISLVKNTFHNFIKRNAVICERLNQKKKTYYMIEMFIGRLAVDSHPHFSEEDKLAATLKQQMRKYRDFLDKNLLPHYAQVVREQSNAYDALKVDPNTPASDLALISKQIEETKAKMHREYAAMSQCMNEAYETWRKISIMRDSQDFASNPVNLQVQELQK